MALTPDHWAHPAEVQASLAAQFALPPLPPPAQEWFAWCGRMATHSLALDTPDWREGCRSELTGSGAVDVPGLLACMEGYRFILDQQASTPTHLVWSDAAESGEWQLHWVILEMPTAIR